jgi:hypothetical protein
MGVSKNNPRNRDRQKLMVQCRDCLSEMKIVKCIPGGMNYKCEKCNVYHPITKGSYKQFPHKWASKK